MWSKGEERVIDDYEIHQIIGSDGGAHVLKATHQPTHLTVAIKKLAKKYSHQRNRKKIFVKKLRF
jgi:serine/threonine protein kinase